MNAHADQNATANALTAQWAALRVMTRREETAVEALREIGCECVFPMYRTLTKPTKKRKPAEVRRPLLPGYVLAQIPQDGWQAVLGCKAVLGWVCRADGSPAMCRADDVARIQKIHDEAEIGVHDHGGLEGRIAPGDSLEVLFGPLEGWRVTYKATKGKVIEGEMEMLGAKRTVKVPAQHVRLSK